MKYSQLLKNFNQALDEACEENSRLETIRAKMNAILEDYAISIGTTVGKLRLVDLCKGDGGLRPELMLHILEIYPLSAKSRPSYVSCAKRLVRAALKTKAGQAEIILSPPTESEIPDEIKRILPYLPREGTRDEIRDSERRQELPFTRNGVFLLLAVLSVWTEFNLTRLESVFHECVGALRRAIRKITRKNHDASTTQLISQVRKALGIKAPERARILIPVEQMLEPLRSEIMTYRTLAPTFGDEKPPDDRAVEKRLIRRASRHGHSMQKLRKTTVESDTLYLCRMYGYILPAIKANGLESFGLKDLMKITYVMLKDEDDEEEERAYNRFFSKYTKILSLKSLTDSSVQAMTLRVL